MIAFIAAAADFFHLLSTLQLRTKKRSLCLHKIIDGPKHSANMQQCVKSFVDELLSLWKGIEIYDASLKKKVLVKVMLVNCLQDGRATRALAL